MCVKNNCFQSCLHTRQAGNFDQTGFDVRRRLNSVNATLRKGGVTRTSASYESLGRVAAPF